MKLITALSNTSLLESNTRVTGLTPSFLAIVMTSALWLLPAISHAETVRIPVGQQGAEQEVSKPRLGMDMNTVEKQFGAPQQRSGPTGEPPITRWQYTDFTVYFEGRTVIHAVATVEP